MSETRKKGSLQRESRVQTVIRNHHNECCCFLSITFWFTHPQKCNKHSEDTSPKNIIANCLVIFTSITLNLIISKDKRKQNQPVIKLHFSQDIKRKSTKRSSSKFSFGYGEFAQ